MNISSMYVREIEEGTGLFEVSATLDFLIQAPTEKDALRRVIDRVEEG